MLNIDEGINGNIVLDIMEGSGPGPVLVEEVMGEEAGTFYIQALFFKLLGIGLAVFRLPAALVGTLFAPIAYLLFRQFVSVLPALLACTLLCFDPVHLYFSRLGNSIGYTPTFQALAFLCLVRIFRQPRLADYVMLGCCLGLGSHTYPAFRCVLVAGMALLAVSTAMEPRSFERRRGLAVSIALVAFALAPFALNPAVTDAYDWRQRNVIGFDITDPQQIGHFLRAAQRIALTVLNQMPLASDEYLLFGDGISGLAVLGLVVLLGRFREHRGPAGSRARHLCFWLGLAVTGIAAPMLARFEAQHARRYILVLLPVYLLVAMALAWIGPVLAPPASGPGPAILRGVGSALLIAAVAAAASPLVQGKFEPASDAQRFVRSAIELGRRTPTIVPASALQSAFLMGRRAMSPEVRFLTRASGTNLSVGLDPYPRFEPAGDVHFVLGDAPWNSFVTRVYPNGTRFAFRPSTERFTALDVYRVSRADVLARRGTRLIVDERDWSQAYDATGFDLESTEHVPPAARKWVAGVRVGRSAWWTWRLGVHSLASLTLDGVALRMNTPVWLSEGWHALEVRQGREERRPPKVEWADESGRFGPVPAADLHRSLPPYSQLRGPVTSDTLLDLCPVDIQLWDTGSREDTLQDLTVSNGRIFSLHTGPVPVRCVRLDGTADPAWSGLRDREGKLSTIRFQRADREFVGGIAAAPEGDLAITDTSNQRVLFFFPDGRLRRVFQLEHPEPGLRGICWDRGSSGFIATLETSGFLFRFSRAGEPRGRIDADAISDLCAAPDGQALYGVAPRLGGIVRLDSRGNQTGFIRCIDVSPLSRLTCDLSGVVHVLVSRSRVFSFTSRGEVCVPLRTLPLNEGGRPYFATSIGALPGGDLIAGTDGDAKGWVRMKLVGLDRTAQPTVFRPAIVPEPNPGSSGLTEIRR